MTNMALYQQSDVQILVNGQEHFLRLSISALMEITDRLQTPTPTELAGRFRDLCADQASVDTMRLILECLLRPSISPPCACGVAGAKVASKALVSTISASAMMHHLPKIALVFELNFAKMSEDYQQGEEKKQRQANKKIADADTVSKNKKAIEWPFTFWMKRAVLEFNLSPSEFLMLGVGSWLSLSKSTKPDGVNRQVLEDLKQSFPDTQSDLAETIIKKASQNGY